MSASRYSESSEEPLFFPSESPATHAVETLDDEVLMALDHTHVDNLNPAVAAFLAEHHAAFFNVFDRRIQLLRSRSQAFEDGHVTVYDKVLLHLTSNGADLTSASAIHYFCEEVLGINLRDTPPRVSEALTQTVTVGSMLKEDLRSDPTLLPYASPRETKQTIEAGHYTSPPPKNPVDAENAIAAMDPKMAKIWTLYASAKEDYFNKAELNDTSSFVAAKFLRDTAENILQQLDAAQDDGGNLVDSAMVQDLHATLKMAKSMVVSLSGGKKRKFDPVDMAGVQGVPIGPSDRGVARPYRQARGDEGRARRYRDEERARRTRDGNEDDARAFREREEERLSRDHDDGRRFRDHDDRDRNPDTRRTQRTARIDDEHSAIVEGSIVSWGRYNDGRGGGGRTATTGPERRARRSTSPPLLYNRKVDRYQPRSGR